MPLLPAGLAGELLGADAWDGVTELGVAVVGVEGDAAGTAAAPPFIAVHQREGLSNQEEFSRTQPKRKAFFYKFVYMNSGRSFR